MPYCKAKMHQNWFLLGLRSASDPAGGAYNAPPLLKTPSWI